MRIHHVNCGTMCPMSARLVNGRGSLFAEGRMVCHCLLVETNDGLALIDTGLGTGDLADPIGRLGRGFGVFARPKLDPDETALAHVARLGFSREDVRHVLPTHLDLDHAGGLSDFPAATVHLFRPEHDAAMKPRTTMEQHRYRRPHWAHGPKWNLLDVAAGGDSWLGFESVRALGGTDDEILLVPTIGHTRGHCAIAVRTGEGWLLHAGDAYFFHGEMEPKPWCTPALAAFQRIAAIDDVARRNNQRRLRALVREHGSEVRVFSAHSPVELAAFS
jgi:glyoxylase-like metal-dependent hydrolase (beta-lactamase superfamily II)